MTMHLSAMYSKSNKSCYIRLLLVYYGDICDARWPIRYNYAYCSSPQWEPLYISINLKMSIFHSILSNGNVVLPSLLSCFLASQKCRPLRSSLRREP